MFWKIVNVVLILLVLVLGAGVFVLYSRLMSAEERLAEIQPALEQLKKDVNMMTVELKLLRATPVPPSVVRSRVNQRRAAQTAETRTERASASRPQTNVPAGTVRTTQNPPQKERSAETENTSQPVADFLGLVEGPNPSPSDVLVAQNSLIKYGPEVLEPLFAALETMPAGSPAVPRICKVVRSLATQQHRDRVLSLFETHDELAGTVSELRLNEAAPVILRKLQDRGRHPAGLVEAVVKLEIEDGYPVIADYAASTGDINAVKILARISTDERDTTEDFVRILQSRDTWSGEDSAETAERVAAILLSRGNRDGFDYLVDQLDTKDLSDMERYAQRMLKRYVDYSGDDIEVWLPVNADNLEWSESRNLFTLP